MKINLIIAFILLIFSCKQKSSLQVKNIYTDTLTVPLDSSKLYFPLKTSMEEDNKNAIDSFLNYWYSEMLFALNEPLLYNLSSEFEIYRFTYLRSFHNPISIRIQKKENQIWLILKKCNGAGGYSPGKLNLDSIIPISNLQWTRLKKEIEAVKFWTLPTERSAAGVGSDGAEWLFEGLRNSTYHFIVRWSPGIEDKEHIEKLGRTFIKLSGIGLKEDEIY